MRMKTGRPTIYLLWVKYKTIKNVYNFIKMQLQRKIEKSPGSWQWNSIINRKKKRQQKEKNQQILINSYGMELDVTIENFSIYIRVSGKVCKQFQWAILHDFHMSEHDFSGATTILRYKSLKLAKMFVFIYWLKLNSWDRQTKVTVVTC